MKSRTLQTGQILLREDIIKMYEIMKILEKLKVIFTQ